jgi:hypothetical protein
MYAFEGTIQDDKPSGVIASYKRAVQDWPEKNYEPDEKRNVERPSRRWKDSFWDRTG